MKNLFCELLPLDHKIKSLVVVDCCFNRLFGQIDLLFYLKSFLLIKIQKRHRAVSNNTQSNFLFKVLIAYAVQCGILNAISKKHFLYPLFVKRIIAIEGTTSLFGLGQTIEFMRYHLAVAYCIIILAVYSTGCYDKCLKNGEYQKLFSGTIYGASY